MCLDAHQVIVGDGSNLTLDAATGQLRVSSMLDYETVSFYLLVIDVTVSFVV